MRHLKVIDKTIDGILTRHGKALEGNLGQCKAREAEWHRRRANLIASPFLPHCHDAVQAMNCPVMPLDAISEMP